LKLKAYGVCDIKTKRREDENIRLRTLKLGYLKKSFSENLAKEMETGGHGDLPGGGDRCVFRSL